MEQNNFTVKQIKEAYKQAEANSELENIDINTVKEKIKVKELIYGNRLLGRIPNQRNKYIKK